MTDLPITDAVLREACAAFAFRGTVCDVKPCGNGHINHTFIITTDENGMRRRYILQVLNTDIFRDPDGVMENIVRVTEHIRVAIWHGRFEMLNTTCGDVYTHLGYVMVVGFTGTP